MQDHSLKTIDQLEAFLQGSEAVSFQLTNQGARYDWLRRTLVRFRYLGLGKRDKGIVLRYGQKVTGYSRQQVTRLVQQYKATGQIDAHYNACRNFARRYTDADIDRLVELINKKTAWSFYAKSAAPTRIWWQSNSGRSMLVFVRFSKKRCTRIAQPSFVRSIAALMPNIAR